MRRQACLIALCVGLLINQFALAAELPTRWVSAGGAMSEWVVALGGESKLVGVDTTSLHPDTLKALPSIGYQRQLSAEGILSLRPNILIGTEEMGPPPVLEQLKAAGVRVEVLSADAQLPAMKDNVQRLGQLLGAEAKAGQLVDAFQQQLQRQQAWVATAQQQHTAPGVLLLVGHAGSKPMVAGTGTVGDWVIKQAGGRNLATHSGYKVFSVEAMAGLNPEVLIFSDRALHGEAAQQALLKENPLLAATKAARDGRLVEMDPTLLVGGLGPRLPQSLQQLSSALYPDKEPMNAKAQPQP
ncbi:hemin ABC transporter substrate-binding protein [Pseudomonas sp. NA-150]|uniref:heme/hemin ABC transporter substrate-binding protein n=1 Tax=Pseudomonas sp. NA-150 TaxID=3367525 RepID=UPI0037C8B47D